MAELTAIETALAKLRQAHNALDSHLGDTDASDFETEEEELEYYPGQWAARTVMEVIQLLDALPAATEIQQARPDLAPGVMRCAKCAFKLIRQNLNVNVGTVTAGGSHSEPCPNGCGPLWPVTWREEALEADKAAVAMFDRAKAAEDRLARLATPAEATNSANAARERWHRAVAAFESCGSDDDVADGFIDQVKAALARGREKGKGGWQTADVAEIHSGLHKSLAAGEPVDVAAYCMFLWSRGDRTEDAAQGGAA